MRIDGQLRRQIKYYKKALTKKMCLINFKMNSSNFKGYPIIHT